MAQSVNSAENESSDEEEGTTGTTATNFGVYMDMEFSDFGSNDTINDRYYFPSSSELFLKQISVYREFAP